MSVRFDNNIVVRIQQATDIVEVVSEHLSLDRKGKEFVGLCPFHADHKPSMYVNPVKQIFKCFACGAGGDVFKFIQLREGLTFPQAIERLAERAGIRLQQRPRPKQGNSGGSDPAEIARVNAWAQKFWQQQLFDEQTGADARNYVASRQIGDETAGEWGIGLAAAGWDNLVKAARAKGIRDKLLVDSGLAVLREQGGLYDKFRNRLMFPILDVTGRVIAFGGRTLGDDPAKYMNSPATALFDKSNSLYGLDKARHSIVADGTAVVVEGYTDVIIAHQAGCTSVVAALGTSFTEGHARALRRYAKRIVLVFDNDVAGMEAANRALEVCLSQRIDIKLTFVSQGNDPCDFILSEGAEAFKRLVADSIDVMEYKWQRLQAGLSASDTLADRRRITEEYLRTVATAVAAGGRDAVAEGLIGTKLSRIIGLSEQETRRQLERYARSMRRNRTLTVRNQKVVSVGAGYGKEAEAQREILEVLLNEPQLFVEVAGRIKVEHFDVAVYREIAEALFSALGDDPGASLAEVLARIESEEGGNKVVELEANGGPKGNFARRLADALEVIESRNAEVVKEELKRNLSDDDTDALRRVSKMLEQGARGQRIPGMTGR